MHNVGFVGVWVAKLRMVLMELVELKMVLEEEEVVKQGAPKHLPRRGHCGT